MKKNLLNTLFGALIIASSLMLAFGQNAVDTSVADSALDSVVTVLLAADGQSHVVGSGLIVRPDGYILTPYSLIKGAREIQVRLHNGETYDKAEVVSTDERRNVAIIRINAAGLRSIPNGTTEESQVGGRVYVVSNSGVSAKNDLILSSVLMADSIPGAGKGYRIMQFDNIGATATGGLLLDAVGRSLGLITTTPDIKGQNIAVPLSSVIGMIRSVPANTVTTSAYVAPVPANTPYPIPQSSVLVPQRGVTALSAKGPGSVVVKPTTVPEILAASKTVFVTSNSATFKPDHMINALNSRQEIKDWGLTFVNERDLADLILEIDHVLFTYKYTFKLYSERLGTVVATGSRIIWDGNLGAPSMADRFIEKVTAARGIQKPSAKPEDKIVTKKDTSK